MNAVTLVLLLAMARPLTLADAVSAAEGNSPAIAGAHITVERAQLAALRAQIDRVRVSVDAQITELFNKPNLGGPAGPGGGDPSPNLLLGLSNLQATASVPLFTGFAITTNVERTQAVEQQSTWEIARLRQELRESVARAYWGIRRLEFLVEQRQLSLAQLKESERIVAARIAAGLAPAIDQNRALQRRLELESNIADLVASAAEERARLAATLGIDDQIVLTEPVDTVGDEQLPPVDDVLAAANTAHPALKVARLSIDLAALDKKLAWSQFYPELSLFMQGQLGNNPQLAGVGARSLVLSPNPFVGVVGDIQAGLVLRMNLFDTFRDWHAVDDAAHRERLAAADARATALQLDAQVKGAHARVQALMTRRVVLLQLRDVARDNEDVMQKSYQRGDALLLDLLDATVARAGAEAQVADVDAQLTEARTLLRLMTAAPVSDPR